MKTCSNAIVKRSSDRRALERRDYLCRFGGTLPRASRNVPPNGSDDREPFQRGLAGVCSRVDEVGAGARGKGKACRVRNARWRVFFRRLGGGWRLTKKNASVNLLSPL